MRIIGLDPGIARTGWGVIDTQQKNMFIACGCLTTQAHQPTPERLNELRDDLIQLITKTQPQVAVVEQIFFGKNTTTAIRTAEARGVLIQTLQEHKIVIEERTPLAIKLQLVGHGRADKKQVQKMVMQILSLDQPPQPDDAADALAASLCLADTSATVKG